MSDRPEYDQEKNYADHRAKWYDEPKYYMSELEFLEQKIEAKLDKIDEQLSALFQLSTKFLRDSMDATIDVDNNVVKFESIDRAINELIVRLKDLENRLSNE